MNDWTYSLKEIRRVAETACEKAIENRADFPNCPTNWADFGVREVAQTLNDKGEFGYYVLIEESGNNRRLHDFLYADLAAAGYPTVEIRLEW